MSNEALNWAFAGDVKPSSAKFVLVAMANCVARGQVTCFPSTQYLIEATGQDRKTVWSSLKALRNLGLIADTGDRRGRTGQVIVYSLNMPESGGLKEGQSRTSLAGESPPKTDSKRSVFPAEEVRFSLERGPKTGDGTLLVSAGRNPTLSDGEAAVSC